MRLLLTLQYLGTNYAGWQTQSNATGIQTVVEEALAKMYGVPLRIEGAGRTDSGVHAAAQRAHFDAPSPIPPRGVMLGLNDRLPRDVRVVAVDEVPGDFHCRFDARSKTYAYHIWNGPVMDVFRRETHAHVAGPLDTGAMQAAMATLIGTHDFKAFTVASPEVATTVRSITAASVTAAAAPPPGARPDVAASAAAHGRTVEIRVTADGFLRTMVRRIAGSLIEVGCGRLRPADVAASLEPVFDAARWTAPARGLVLEEIRY